MRLDVAAKSPRSSTSPVTLHRHSGLEYVGIAYCYPRYPCQSCPRAGRPAVELDIHTHIYYLCVYPTVSKEKGPGTGNGRRAGVAAQRHVGSAPAPLPARTHARTRWCAGGGDDGRDGRCRAEPRRNNPARVIACRFSSFRAGARITSGAGFSRVLSLREGARRSARCASRCARIPPGNRVDPPSAERCQGHINGWAFGLRLLPC